MLNSSVSLGFSIIFFITMICADGHADINKFGEGWLETATWFGISIFGFVQLWQNHRGMKRDRKGVV